MREWLPVLGLGQRYFLLSAVLAQAQSGSMVEASQASSDRTPYYASSSSSVQACS